MRAHAPARRRSKRLVEDLMSRIEQMALFLRKDMGERVMKANQWSPAGPSRPHSFLRRLARLGVAAPGLPRLLAL